MNLLFLTSGSGKIFEYIFKDRIISTKNIYLYGDFRAGCKKIANKKVKTINVPGPTGVRGRNSDNTLIEEKLNWKPSLSLEDGLKKTFIWIDQQAKNLAN